ncbi:MAG: hypothetical protein QE271_05685 [Bacteriovoracaceae bacterium]|nr:hypothetical protein [Bacteriovoracaceae bacterium]
MISLKRRIEMSYIVAVAVILILSLINFFYLENLHKKLLVMVNTLTTENTIINEISHGLENQRKLIINQFKDPYQKVSLREVEDNIKTAIELINNNKTFFSDPTSRSLLDSVQQSVESILSLIPQLALNPNRPSPVLIEGFQSYFEQISTNIGELNTHRSKMAKDWTSSISSMINETKRVMLVILIIGFLASILVAMVVPAKVTLPFKKISDAIREIQECNFDVSIYYNQKDEIGELTTEINKMIKSIKHFEELRADRISVELRKFDILANLTKKYVIVSNSEGQIVYVNNPLYGILELSSEDLLHKHYDDSLIPESIKEAMELAIKRRTKVENAEIIFDHSSQEAENDGQELKQVSFKGFANIIPIRGKESSLDYYLMVLSKEFFA